MNAGRNGRPRSTPTLPVAVAAAVAQQKEAYHRRVSRAVDALVTRRLDVVARATDRYGTYLPRARWHATVVDDRILKVRGHLGSQVAPEEMAAAVAAWRSALQLDAPGPARDGRLDVRGTFDGAPIVVWGIVDRATFDAAYRS